MNEIEALRITIAILTANLALLEKKPANTYLGQILPLFDTNEAERQRLADIASRSQTKPWQAWVSGVLPSDVGDNDKPDDDFLRAFGPMMDAAKMQGFKDSTNEIFFYPRIKSRNPLGWLGVKTEALRMVDSDWGQSWMSNVDNIRAGTLVPTTAAVMLLIKQVGANKLPA